MTELRQRRRAPRPGESPQDLSGQRFGALTVTCYAAKESLASGRAYWNVKCDCGKELAKRWTSIRDGKRCGQCTPVNHGHAKRGCRSPEFTVWASMIDRCYRQGNKKYSDYGGRGILVCRRWRNSFTNFFADMGPKPSPRHEIERKKNNQGYNKSNCTWATRSQQNRNRRDTVRVYWNGRKLSLADACDLSGISYSMVRQRIRKGWNHKLALSTPKNGFRHRVVATKA
jgi:hypothetical protein